MPPVVSLTELKAHLGITDSTDDAELDDTLDEAIAAIEDIVGPLSPQTFVEQIDNHGGDIVLSRTPVVSVQSVSIEPWLGATATDDTAGWRLNTATGVLRRQVTGGALPFYGRGSVFTVTYTAGYSDVPGAVNRAIKTQAKSMWKSQRVPTNRPVSGAAAQTPIYQGNTGFLAPEVMELLTPLLPPPGAA
jgi:uncharacterized phiE125 gp8 family phage protein